MDELISYATSIHYMQMENFFFILQLISNIGLVYTLFIGSSITKARQCKQSLKRLKTISNEIKTIINEINGKKKQLENVLLPFIRSHVEGNQLGFRKNDYSPTKTEYSSLL